MKTTCAIPVQYVILVQMCHSTDQLVKVMNNLLQDMVFSVERKLQDIELIIFSCSIIFTNEKTHTFFKQGCRPVDFIMQTST